MKKTTKPDFDDSLLRKFFADYANRSTDPFCGNMLLWQTDNLQSIWNEALQHDRAATVPYWAIAWPGGRALARYLLEHPHLCRNRNILDIGTGNGVTAIAAALCGGNVTGLDNDWRALKIAETHANINRVTITWLQTDLCDTNERNATKLIDNFDLVLAGDIFNSENFAEKAIALFQHAAQLGLETLCADCGRSFRPRSHTRHVETISVPVNPKIEGIRERTAQIFSFT